MIGGIYPADLDTTPLTVAAVIYSGNVKVNPDTLALLATHSGPVALVNAAVTGGSIYVDLGTYDASLPIGTRFTLEKRIATITAGASPTATAWPLKMIPPNKAIKVELTAGTGYIRHQGLMAPVPA